MKTTFFSAMKLWNSLPLNVKERWTRNSFKYSLRKYLSHRFGTASNSTVKLRHLNREQEISINRVRCDLKFNSHLFSHNFTTVLNPCCKCGHRSQTTSHVLLNCPLGNNLRIILHQQLFDISPIVLEEFNSTTNAGKVNLLLYGHERFQKQINARVIYDTATFLIDMDYMLS